MFKATEETPVRLPARATSSGAIPVLVTRLKPSEGTARLLTALIARDGPWIKPGTDKQRLLDLATTHA